MPVPPLFVRRSAALSPYDTPEPGVEGSSEPEAIERRMEREASMKGVSTFEPVREDVSRKRAPDATAK
jgi:hypothetical protein